MVILINASFFLMNPYEVYALSYKFPWPQTYNRDWRQGWHPSNALDLGATDTYDLEKNTLMMAEGFVKYICNDGISHYVQIEHEGSNFYYVHLQLNQLENNITVNKFLKQGQLIGPLKPGTFGSGSSACGYTSGQPSTSAHLHLQFPNSNSRTIDGWVLSANPTNTMTQGGTTKTPGSTLNSNNTMLLRDETITTSKTYRSEDTIILEGDGNGLVLAPTGSNVITISVF